MMGSVLQNPIVLYGKQGSKQTLLLQKRGLGSHKPAVTTLRSRTTPLPRLCVQNTVMENVQKSSSIISQNASFPIMEDRRLWVTLMADLFPPVELLAPDATSEKPIHESNPWFGKDQFVLSVNGCTGKMGRAVIEAATSAGLQVVPVSFSGPENAGQIVQIGGTEIHIHGPSEREDILASTFHEFPNVIVVDYTVPTAVNENAEFYCKVGVPFVMGTTGGDRKRLYETVQDSKVYAVISPQMGKQVVAFIAAMEIMAEQFPGAFSGYELQVMESHQAGKLDTSGTAKEVIACFQKLGVSFDLDQVKKIRDPKKQLELVGVPEEHLSGHAFHMYHLISPDNTVSFEFQHNVCGRTIYAEGSIDAAIFLASKIESKADKRIYNMIDVLRGGNMR